MQRAFTISLVKSLERSIASNDNVKKIVIEERSISIKNHPFYKNYILKYFLGLEMQYKVIDMIDKIEIPDHIYESKFDQLNQSL